MYICAHIYVILWYDMIFYDIILNGMIWYGIIWYDMIWYDKICCLCTRLREEWRKRAHVRMPTCKTHNTRVRACLRAFVFLSSVCEFARSCGRAFVRSCVRACVCTHAYMRVWLSSPNIHAYIRTCVHTYVHTYMRTYVRTYAHTYVHTYTHNTK